MQSIIIIHYLLFDTAMIICEGVQKRSGVLSVYSPILSHTLTVVVQCPKFGHSTTLNNKGYKPHRETRDGS